MNKVFLFVSLLAPTIYPATEKKIIAKVVFENFTEIDFTSGKFFIKELNKIIEIGSEDSFTITLPEKGKYQFGFYSEEFDSYTYYSERIGSKKNIITIRLQNKGPGFDTGKMLKAFSQSSYSGEKRSIFLC